MSDEPGNVMLRLLRDLRADARDPKKDNADIEQRLEELHQTPYMTAGLSMHANVKQGTFAKRFASLEGRVEKLEEKV